MRSILLALLMICVVPSIALADQAESRAKVKKMRTETLERLYKEDPGAKTNIDKSYGYAVFQSGGLNVILASLAYGYGIAHNNESHGDTYMEMASGGLGLGLGVKDYRLVFVFRTKDAFNGFVSHGWDFSGQADAAAKAGQAGGEISEAVDVMPGVKVYQLTENGLALQATLQGTKYWVDEDLNF
jgi:lipid-binding SYLF domain-containing protein